MSVGAVFRLCVGYSCGPLGTLFFAVFAFIPKGGIAMDSDSSSIRCFINSVKDIAKPKQNRNGENA